MPLPTRNGGVDSHGQFPAVWVMPAALRQLVESGDFELVEELITIFQSDTASRLKVLQGAVAAGDFVKARMEAHTIKGSAVQLGAIRLAGLCQQIEGEAKLARAADLNRLLDRLTESFEDVCTVISRRKESTGSQFPW